MSYIRPDVDMWIFVDKKTDKVIGRAYSETDLINAKEHFSKVCEYKVISIRVPICGETWNNEVLIKDVSE